MPFHICNQKFIYFIVIGLSLVSNIFAMESSLGKRLLGKGKGAYDQPGAKVQKTEDSSAVAFHKLRKKIIKQFKEIGRGSVELSAELRSFISENPNIRDERGNALLHYALLFTNQELIDLLIKNPIIDVTIKNDEGLSLLALAVQQRNERVVKAILNKVPKSVDILNEFLFDVFALLEETAYVMNDCEIIKLLEGFVIFRDYIKIDALKPGAMFCSQPPGYRKHSAKSLARLTERCSKSKEMKKFFEAKNSIICLSERLVDIIWNYDQHYNLNLNWQEPFTLEAQNVLCSAFSRGIVTGLLYECGRGYDSFPYYKLFNFLFDIDTTLDPDLKNRLRVILEYCPEDMQHIDLDQKDREKLPLELLLYLLSHAILLKDKEFLRTSLNNNNSYIISKQDLVGDTLLHNAVNSQNLDILQLLLIYCPNLNIRNNKGKTPLHKAVASCEFEIIQAILACGPDLTIRDNKGQTPLYYAVGRSDLETVQAILACKPKLVSHDRYRLLGTIFKLGRIPMLKAVLAHKKTGAIIEDNHAKIALEILNYIPGSDLPNTCPKLIKLFFHSAISVSDIELIQEILKIIPHLAKMGIPLHIAMGMSNNINVVKTLLEYEPNLNCQDSNGDTPLHVAMNRYKHSNLSSEQDKLFDMIDILLNCDLPLDMSIKNNQGNTVFDLSRDVKIYNRLLEAQNVLLEI